VDVFCSSFRPSDNGRSDFFRGRHLVPFLLSLRAMLVRAPFPSRLEAALPEIVAPEESSFPFQVANGDLLETIFFFQYIW